ncbi:carboxylesterase family protein [Thalassotalea sp. G2M2-11]|uniref:carboxylesterase family protein n=1 Tax=Thalassotalea sp. G2M2-11 TaxID=2787627 RepID=UPI0019D09D0A|nr:carboxylesterase family protein [Thalassotalea sp. G2M2-11]
MNICIPYLHLMNSKSIVAIVFSAIFLIFSPVSSAHNKTQLNQASLDKAELRVTTAGQISGKLIKDNAVITWLGVPYAQAPIGNLRWKAPQPVIPWKGVRSATQHPQACPQYTDELDSKRYIGTEDCLFLNIWRPNNNQPQLPVHVYIHGGSNEQGMINNPARLGDVLAQEGDMVVVTMQYRLGFLGWLYSHEDKSIDELDNSGNLGLLDIIESLKWVKNNIHSFGGDPNNITLGGLSAGAQNIFNLLATNMASGLFHKAFIQSGIPIDYSKEQAKQASVKLEQTLLGKKYLQMSAKDIDKQMLDIPAKAIVDAGMKINPDFNAVRDGVVMPLTPTAQLISDGNLINKVPIMVGLTKDEAKAWTCDRAYNVFNWLSPADASLVGQYATELLTALTVETFYHASQHSSSWPIYFYEMGYGSPDEQGRSPLPDELGDCIGAFHTIDTSFHFGRWQHMVQSFWQQLTFSDNNDIARKNLSKEMMLRFVHFANHSHPNYKGAVVWPKISTGSKINRLLFDVDVETSAVKAKSIDRLKSIAEIKAEIDQTFSLEQKKTLFPLINAFVSQFQGPEHALLSLHASQN